MDIIACCKMVPEEQDIVVLSDGNLSFDRAEWKIGQYDLNAIEAGTVLVEGNGGKVSVVSAGNTQIENSKLKKSVLSRGPEELFLVVDDALGNADAHQVAQALEAAVKKIGKFDLVLCGEGSSDLYAQQVGIQLGELLNLPTINAVSKITPAGEKVIVERMLESEVEVLEVILPAVISVTTDINLPRVPNLKNIIAAGKKPTTSWSLADVELGNLPKSTEIISTLAPKALDRKQIVVEGDTVEAVNKIFDSIRKELQ